MPKVGQLPPLPTEMPAGIYGWDGSAWQRVQVDASKFLKVILQTSSGVDIGDVSIANWPTAPAIYNVTMTNADTEYSQALPANTRKFLIKCRTSFAVKLSFTSGESGTTYLTVPADQSYWEDQINDAAITLYFQCADAGKVAEIVAWS